MTLRLHRRRPIQITERPHPAPVPSVIAGALASPRRLPRRTPQLRPDAAVGIVIKMLRIFGSPTGGDNRLARSALRHVYRTRHAGGNTLAEIRGLKRQAAELIACLDAIAIAIDDEAEWVELAGLRAIHARNREPATQKVWVPAWRA